MRHETFAPDLSGKVGRGPCGWMEGGHGQTSKLGQHSSSERLRTSSFYNTVLI